VTGKTRKHLGLKLFYPLCTACVCFPPSSSGTPVPTEPVAPRWRGPNHSEYVALLEGPEPLRACGPLMGESRTAQAERSPLLARKESFRRENGRLVWPYRSRLPRKPQGIFLRVVNVRHGTHSFTSLPKEGMLRIFTPGNNPTALAGFELAILGTRGQHANH
jgi:hypothetical protein